MLNKYDLKELCMYILKNKEFVIIYILLAISKHRRSWSLTMKEDAYILKDADFFLFISYSIIYFIFIFLLFNPLYGF